MIKLNSWLVYIVFLIIALFREYFNEGLRWMLEKGQELERKIESFFQLNGYKTQRNVVLEGKSGGKHEIDVLAEKSDGITTFRVMVECKAWNKPIEKDVVSKVSYVVRDLGPK